MIDNNILNEKWIRPTEVLALDSNPETNSANAVKLSEFVDDDQLIQCAALMYGHAQDVDTESSGVFEVSANDNLYVILLSFAHKVAAIYEFSRDEEDDMDTMRRVSEEYFQSVMAWKDMDGAAWLRKVCEECDCPICNRVLESLQCAA